MVLSVSVLHECSVYNYIVANKCRATFIKKLEELLRDRYLTSSIA